MKTMFVAVFLLVIAIGGLAVEGRALTPSNKSAHGGALSRSLMVQRQLQILSQQCLNETAEIFFNSSVQTTYDEWTIENEGNLASCVNNATAEDCTLDSKTYSTHDALVAACTDEGGVNHFYNTSFNCGITLNGTDSSIQVSFVDFVECVAPSCNLDAVANEGETALTDLFAERYEESLVNLTDSAECTWTWAPTASPTDDPDAEDDPEMGDDGNSTMNDGNGAPTTNGNGTSNGGDTPDPTSSVFITKSKGSLVVMSIVAALQWFL